MSGLLPGFVPFASWSPQLNEGFPMTRRIVWIFRTPRVVFHGRLGSIWTHMSDPGTGIPARNSES